MENDNQLEARAVSVKEARSRLGNMSHSRIYELINDGSLKTCKIGKRRLVPVDSIRELIETAA